MAHAVTDRTTCLAGGSTRAGKTTAVLHGFAVWVLKEGMGFHHAITGQTIESIMRNIGWDLITLFGEMGVSCKFTRDVGTRIDVHYNGLWSPIWIMGAGDERAYRRLLGATLKGLLVEELVLLPESFFNVAWGRLSVKGAKMWASYNPDNPRHWVKEKVVDRVEEFDGVLYEFEMRDNPSLPDEVIERYERSFVGHWHTRMVLGQWAGATGLIFPTWFPIEEPLESERHVVSLDWGVSTVFHALLFRAKGPRADCVSELHYDGRLSEPREEREHVAAVKAWLLEEVGTVREIVVYVDPSTPASFKRILRDEGMVVRNADNDVLPGLVTTASRLHRGEIRIGDCPELKRNMAGYVWDEKKSEAGVDAPVKANDHGCDALRYYAHSTGKMYRLMEAEPSSVARALAHV